MPTNLKEFYLFILFFTVLIFSVGIFISFRETESFEILTKSRWKVKRIKINHKDVTDQYECLNLSMRYNKKSTLILPKEKIKQAKDRYGTWQYFRTGWFDGNVRFKNENSLFSGEYSIDVLGHQNPKVILLVSDSVEFYLQEEYLSFKGPSIAVNFFDCKD